MSRITSTDVRQRWSSLRPVLLVAAGGAALVLTGCSLDVDIGDTSRRVETDTIPAEGVARLVIETENGMVEVRGGDVEEVEIESIFDESERGDGSADIDRDEGTVSVTGDCDAEWHERCAVGFRIVAPSGVDVIVATDNGRIALDSLAGRIDVSTDNGRIEAGQLAAELVEAHTDNGRVDLTFTTAPANVQVRTDNGRIDVRVPVAESGYAVDAEADNGAVDVDVATDATSPRRITAYSDNGAVTVTSRASADS